MEKQKEEIEKKEDLGMCRCGMNKAIIRFTPSALDFAHGFIENICQECYDKLMKSSDWYKQGSLFKEKEMLDDEIKFLSWIIGFLGTDKNTKRAFEVTKERLENIKKDYQELKQRLSELNSRGKEKPPSNLTKKQQAIQW